MALNFNADEIFEMAETIEKNGAAFYRKAAEGFDDDKTTNLLLGLADMEDEHLKTFAAMRADLVAEHKKATVYDPDGEAALYLQAFADGNVFDVSAKPADLLKGDETLPRVLRIAIGLEKDSIAFYTGLKDLVPEKLGKGKIKDIIAEEMRHVTLLSRQLAASV